MDWEQATYQGTDYPPQNGHLGASAQGGPQSAYSKYTPQGTPRPEPALQSAGFANTGQGYGSRPMQASPSPAYAQNNYRQGPADQSPAEKDPLHGFRNLLQKISNESQGLPSGPQRPGPYQGGQPGPVPGPIPGSQPQGGKAFVDMDWGRLSKLETAQKIFPGEVFEAFARPEQVEQRMLAAAEQDKKKVGGREQVSEDVDEVLKGCIQLLDEVKSNMARRVDSLTQANLAKFRQYHQLADQAATKASDMMHRVEAENTISQSSFAGLDPLTRDIETMRLKRLSAQKIEDLLLSVKKDIQAQHLEEGFHEFRLLAEGRATLYDEAEADHVYRRLVADLADNIKAKNALNHCELVRDPFSAKKQPLFGNTLQGPAPALAAHRPSERQTQKTSPGQNQSVNPANSKPGSTGFADPRADLSRLQNTTNPAGHNATFLQPADLAPALILQQNHAIIDRSAFRGAKVALDKTVFSPHSKEITALLSLSIS